MRRLLLLSAFSLLPSAVLPQQKVDLHRAALPNASVRLMGFFGAVKVTGWDADSIVLVGSLGAGSTFHGPPESDLVMGMKAYVEAPSDASARSTRLELFVPRNARVWIKSGSANIDVKGVRGSLDLNLVGGSVTVDGKLRELIVEAMDASVTFGGFADFAKIKTATGGITLQAHGDDFTATTVSGIILATDQSGPFQRARFESVTGPIVFSGELAQGGDCRFDTHSGNVELRMPKSSTYEIDASSVTGTIENLFSKARPATGREGRGMELGTGGGAGAPHVTIRSFKGNVRLLAR